MDKMFYAGVEITLESKIVNARVIARCWREDEFFIVDHPGDAWDIRIGRIVCRIVRGGVYYSFTSEIIEIAPDLNFMVLSYPKDVIETSFRSDPRFDVMLPVTIYRGSTDNMVEKSEGMITDISKGGCQLNCSRSYARGEKIFLKGAASLEGASGVIVAIVQRDSTQIGDKFAFGLKFESAGFEKEMEEFFALIERYHNAPPAKHQVVSDEQLIPIGEPCQIQISGAKYDSHIRGFYFPKFIFFDAPVFNDVLADSKPGNTHVVRYFHSGAVCAFESKLLKQFQEPYFLWIYDFPEKIESVNLRASKRVGTILSGCLESSMLKSDGAVVDLSDGGMLFVAESGGFKSGDVAAITVSLPSGEIVKDLKVDVKNVEVRDGKEYVGLAFMDKQSEQLGTLLKFHQACVDCVE